jgi:PIN domain nuclease of toxin-antitoxin system
MRLLLDTNVLIGLVDNSRKSLPHRLQGQLDRPDGEFYVSVASLWEIAIKYRLKKLTLPVEPEDIPSLLDQLQMILLPITARHVLTFVEPEPKTRDPFDRLLLAQCEAEGLRLVTSDRELSAHRLAAPDR